MRSFAFCAFFIFAGTLAAQPLVPGAEAAALGGSFVTATSGVSARHNVAALAAIKQNTLLLGVRNNYLASSLNDVYLLATLRLQHAALGCDVHYYGFDVWQYGEFGLSYARVIAQGWHVGARLSYAYNYIPQERVNRSLLAADLGLHGILGRWRVGAALLHFAQSSWQGRVKERSPVTLRIGGGYYFEGQTALTAELHKSSAEGADVRLGLQYAPVDAVILRLGFAALRPSVGFGLGIKLAAFQIHVAAAWHQQLGLSPVTDVAYAW